jgi:ABC-type sugar transport system ATPase subunit
VKTLPMSSTRESKVVSLMVGRELLAFHRQEATPSQQMMFEVRGLTKGRQYNGLSFKIHRGEIVALAGLIGVGRSEMAFEFLDVRRRTQERSWSTVSRSGSGELRMRCAQGSPRRREDRKSAGLILGASVGNNVSMAVLPRLARAQFIDQKAERTLIQRFVARLNIRTPSQQQRVGLLSGGNQQKVMLAKWLAV